MRCARAAPRTTPIASEPAMPIPATLSVFFRPCQKSGRCSRMKCQSMLARRLKREGSGRVRVAAAPGRVLPRGAVRDGVLPERVREAVVRPRHRAEEAVDQRRWRARPPAYAFEDLRELVVRTHVSDRAVDPRSHRAFALPDPDPPRDREELVVGQLER